MSLPAPSAPSAAHHPAAFLVQVGSAFRREFRAQRKALLGWTLPGLGLLGVTLAMQPAMAKEGSLFEAKMAMLPKEMLSALGMEATNMADPVVWLATGFIYPALLGGLMAGLLGASILAREEQGHTAELLLVQPVSRLRLLVGKLLAAILVCVVYAVAMAGFGMVVYAAVDVGDYNVARYIAVFAGLLMCQLSVLAVTLAVSAFARARGAMAVGLGVTFGLWGTGTVGAITESLKPLTWFSPFKATDPGTIATTGALPGSVWLWPVVVIAAVLLALWRYGRKDIHG